MFRSARRTFHCKYFSIRRRSRFIVIREAPTHSTAVKRPLGGGSATTTRTGGFLALVLTPFIPLLLLRSYNGELLPRSYGVVTSGRADVVRDFRFEQCVFSAHVKRTDGHLRAMRFRRQTRGGDVIERDDRPRGVVAEKDRKSVGKIVGRKRRKKMYRFQTGLRGDAGRHLKQGSPTFSDK